MSRPDYHASITDRETKEQDAAPTRLFLSLPFWKTKEKALLLTLYECDYGKADARGQEMPKHKTPMAQFSFQLEKPEPPPEDVPIKIWPQWAPHAAKMRVGPSFSGEGEGRFRPPPSAENPPPTAHFPFWNADLEVVIGKRRFPVVVPLLGDYKTEGKWVEIGFDVKGSDHTVESFRADQVTRIRKRQRHYHQDKRLRLFYDPSGTYGQSIDEEGGKTMSRVPTAPLDYVLQLQKDLHELGYYDGAPDGIYGQKTRQAVTRFQLDARRPRRAKRNSKGGPPKPVAPDPKPLRWNEKWEKYTGVCTPSLALEIKEWIKKDWVAPVVEYAILSPKPPKTGPLKQFVNLEPKKDTRPPNSGRVLEIEVGAKGDEDGKKKLAGKGDVVFVKCTFTRTNTKRTKPKPQLLPEGVEEWKEADGGKTFTGKITIGADGGSARFKVDLGYAGKETWTIEVGANERHDHAKLQVETWRRIYYQITRSHHAKPNLTDFVSCMNEVGIDVAALKDLVLKPGSTPGKNVPYWLDGKDFTKYGAKKGTKYLMAHYRNSDRAFDGLLDTKRPVVNALAKKEQAPPELTAHFVLADELMALDFGEHSLPGCLTDAATKKVVSSTTSQVKSEFPYGDPDLQVDKIVVNLKQAGVPLDRFPATRSPISKVKWYSGISASLGHFSPKEMAFDRRKGILTVTPKANEEFQRAVNAKKDFDLTIQYDSSADRSGGVALTVDRGQHLIISNGFGKRAAVEVCCIISHELGHALDMCLADDYSAVSDLEAARRAHTRHYELNGDHCADNLKDAEFKRSKVLEEFKGGTCVMFGTASDATSYCDKCKPFFLALSVKEFTKA